MKMTIHRIYLLIILICSVACFTSCSKIDEVPPRQQQNSSSKHYKMPDPAPLSVNESDSVNSIKNEYRNNTN